MSRRFTIGRERNSDVLIADESVSRVHAEIWLSEDGALMLADRGSSNGTMLLRSGQIRSLTNEVVLPTDQIRFGGVTIPVADLIEAIELKNPGVLTPAAKQARRPPVPALNLSPLPPPLPQKPAAVHTYNVPMSPPRPNQASGAVVRCECGAIKTIGQPCPSCHR